MVILAQAQEKACSGRGFQAEEHRVSARDEADGVVTGEEQENQPLPLPPPPPPPPPPSPPAVGMRLGPEAEQLALVVESRVVLAHRALVSYEQRKEEEAQRGQEEQGGDAGTSKVETSTPTAMEGCSEPRTAKGGRRARGENGNGGGPRVAGRGSVRRLLYRRTRPKPARARHKTIESWKLEAS